MNKFAYLTTSLAIKKLSQLSKLHIRIHGEENIPDGSIIFVANHFTRIETLFLARRLHQLTGIPIWSLADYSLFKGPLAAIFDKLGVVSTRDPNRDRLMVKTLLTGEAAWVVYPEGRMVKSKKIIEKGRYMISHAKGKHPPHTGAATLALRTEFYRQRLKALEETAPHEAKRLLASFELDTFEQVLRKQTYLVPINITYYPLRVQENMISTLLEKALDDLSERSIEEVMAEGTMLLSGVDVDIRFGKPLGMEKRIQKPFISKDIASPRRIDFDDPIPSRRSMRKIALEIMFRYMSAIYHMTTVNHDHLFASLLRAIPGKKIDEMNFRRKAFLVATQDLDKTGVYLHEDLKKDQVHLLTDDRFSKYNTFLSLALDTGVIKKGDGSLIKDPSKFEHIFNFHRVRVENPVQVMANEVEPLKKLLRKIRFTAWRPASLVRRQIAERLMNRAVHGFEEAYAAFFSKDESKDKEVGMPYLMGNRFKRTGIVLIHGYMAAPPEVRELAVYLSKRGFLVYAPRVSGHGTSPDDLATQTREDWMASVDEAYAIVSSLCRQVVVGGFSTGAGLALDLGTRINGITALFAVSPPLRLQDFSVRFLPAVGFWNRSMDLINMEGAKKEFIENTPENPHINYFRNPLSGVRELGLLMASVEKNLPKITIPALVIQANGDPIVNPKGSRRVFELISSTDKEYEDFSFNRHGILLGEGAEKVYGVIGDFLERVTAK
jgi:esterase/lipase/1-acyl-sn-glycerol-3-phosphate acyltransferase